MQHERRRSHCWQRRLHVDLRPPTRPVPEPPRDCGAVAERGPTTAEAPDRARHVGCRSAGSPSVRSCERQLLSAAQPRGREVPETTTADGSRSATARVADTWPRTSTAREAVRHVEERGSLRANRVEHRKKVVDVHLDGRRRRIKDRVGRPLTTKVEGDHPREPAQRVHERASCGRSHIKSIGQAHWRTTTSHGPLSEHLEGESLAVPNGVTHLDITHDARLPDQSQCADESLGSNEHPLLIPCGSLPVASAARVALQQLRLS